MEFNFKIKEDRLIAGGMLAGNSGNVNTYTCRFDIADNADFTWLCVFSLGDEVYQQVIENGKCVIPKEVLENAGTFRIGCYGTDGDVRISTNWLEFSIAGGAYCQATMPQEPTPDVWETLVMNSLPYIGENGNWYVYDKAEKVYKDSTKPSRGEKGDKGDTGDAGKDGKDGYTPQRGTDYWTEEDRTAVREELEEDLNFEERLASTVGNYGNTIKGTASGEVIALHDVSPVEHIMDVKVRSDTVTDLTSITVKKYGSNILDVVNAPIYHTNAYVAGYSWERTNTGAKMTALVDNATPSYRMGYYIGTIEELKGKTLTISGQFEGPSNAAISIMSCNIEGSKANSIEKLSGYQEARLTVDNIKTIKSTDSSYDTQVLTCTLPETMDYPYVVVCFYGAVSIAVAAGEVSEWSNIQVQISDTKTEYEPYKEPTTYTPNADGMVEGVTALCPSTTFISDTEGVIIDCEYNRDINKAFEELTNAIISLGGNI